MTDETEVLSANEAFYRAFEKKDMDAMSGVWSKGTGSVCIHPGREPLRGWDSIRSSWEQIFRATSYLEIDLEIIATEVSENLASIVVKEKVRQISRGRSIQAQSMATNLYEKLGGKWYLIHHHGSPILR